VVLVPEQAELKWTWNDGVVTAIVPRVEIHAIVVIE